MISTVNDQFEYRYFDYSNILKDLRFVKSWIMNNLGNIFADNRVWFFQLNEYTYSDDFLKKYPQLVSEVQEAITNNEYPKIIDILNRIGNAIAACKVFI